MALKNDSTIAWANRGNRVVGNQLPLMHDFVRTIRVPKGRHMSATGDNPSKPSGERKTTAVVGDKKTPDPRLEPAFYKMVIDILNLFARKLNCNCQRSRKFHT